MLRRFTILLIPAMMGLSLSAQQREADLKAAFIYNFTKYIDWDSTGLNEGFTIGIIGSSPVTSSLQKVARSNTIKNKKIVVKQYDRPEDIGSCHILFIPRHCPFLLESILDRTRKGTLTISEEAGFARLGTALNFILVNDKLKFEANLKAISSAGLNAGSQLLKLAVIVD